MTGEPVRDGDLGDTATDTDAELRGWLREDFGVEAVSLSRMAGGADATAAVWRAVDTDGAAYAAKLSRSEMAAGLRATAHLVAAGVRGVPAPLPARSGKPWSHHDGAQLCLTPWVAGRRGAEPGMDAEQWRSFGRLLAEVHAADVPSRLRAELPVEDYRPVAASTVRVLDARVREAAAGGSGPTDPTGALVAALVHDWRTAADRIATLTDRVEDLGRDLRSRRADTVLTHGDAHAYNVVIEADGQVWLIDWDGAMVASRERDLVFVVGGVLADQPVSREQQSEFFAGYGRVDVDPMRLAYHLCLRALEDLGGWATDVLDSDRTLRDRADAVTIFCGLVSPTGIVEQAMSSLRWV